MKIRTMFVSNSSSSSFIVVFPKRPETSEELYKMMFPHQEKTDEVDCYDYTLPIEKVVENVFNDIEEESIILEKADTKKSKAEKMVDYYKAVKKLKEHLASGYRYEYDIQRGWLNEFYGSSYDCWGTDKEIMDKIKNLTLEQKKANDNYWAEYHSKKQDKKQLEKLNEIVSTLHKEHWGLIEQAAEADAKVFVDRYKDKFIVQFTYSDNDGQEGCVMEHGKIFSRLTHIDISQH